MAQLKMIFSFARQLIPPMPELSGNFRLCTFKPARHDAYLELRKICGFNPENAEADLAAAQENLRPAGFFLIEETATGNLIASAMARRGYFRDYDNLSWVMTHPDYRGHALGTIVVTAALRRSLDAHAAGMTLATDDFREPALRMYFKLGWRPWLYTEEDRMKQRWLELRDKLGIEAAGEFTDFSC